jgi:hypothetical protein
MIKKGKVKTKKISIPKKYTDFAKNRVEYLFQYEYQNCSLREMLMLAYFQGLSDTDQALRYRHNPRMVRGLAGRKGESPS